MFNQYPYINENDLNLDWVIKQIKTYTALVDDLETWKVEHEAEYLELKQLYDNILAGNFPPEMYNTLHNWVVQNSASIMESLTKMVFFAITDTGYFVAYIPGTWDDIIFNTSGYDENLLTIDFGHLVLSY